MQIDFEERRQWIRSRVFHHMHTRSKMDYHIDTTQRACPISITINIIYYNSFHTIRQLSKGTRRCPDPPAAAQHFPAQVPANETIGARDKYPVGLITRCHNVAFRWAEQQNFYN
jgi:hypothetical protein